MKSGSDDILKDYTYDDLIGISEILRSSNISLFGKIILIFEKYKY